MQACIALRLLDMLQGPLPLFNSSSELQMSKRLHIGTAARK